MKRKILSYVLSLMLIMTMLPTQLLAQDFTQMLQSNNLSTVMTTTSSQLVANPYRGDGFEAEFNVLSQWDGSFTGEIKLTNIGTEPIENWALTFDFEHEITNIWNSEIISHEDDNYIVKNLKWNQDIAVGESIVIGVQGVYNDEVKFPTNFELLIQKNIVNPEGYMIDFRVTDEWEDAFNGEISIQNNTEEIIEDWMLKFEFDKEITSLWEAQIIEHQDNYYMIKNNGYNGNIEPGETILLGFSGRNNGIMLEPEKYVLTQVTNVKDTRIEIEYDGNSDFLYTKPIEEEDIRQGVISLEYDNQIYSTDINYVKNQLVFYTDEKVAFDQVRELVKKYDGIIVGYVSAIDFYQVEFKECTLEQLLEIAEQINKEELIYEETTYLNVVSMPEQQSTESTILPNDPWEGNVDWNEDNPNGGNWGLECIKAISAWQYSEQMQPVNVAVIDKELYSHEDIGFARYSDKEMFLDESLIKKPTYDVHGNQVTGILGATHNNGVGISGVAPNVNGNIYGVSCALTLAGSNLVSTIADLVKNKGVKVINYSIGDGEYMLNAEIAKKTTGPGLKKLLKEYEFLIVSAAGNSGDTEFGYKLNNEFTAIEDNEVKKNIIVAGAIENEGNGQYKISKVSQLGDGLILAPGKNIYTTMAGSGYRFVAIGDGATSYAAPHVAGVAAMLWGIEPEKTGAEIKDIIMKTAEHTLEGRDGNTYGIVNAYKAVAQLATGVLSGTVKNASDSTNINGANIFVDGILVTSTDSDGKFSCNLSSDKTHQVTIVAENLGEVSYNDIKVNRGETVNLIVEIQAAGVASGSIKSAVDLSPVKGANIYVDGILRTYSDESGEFSCLLSSSNIHTITIVAEGFLEVNYCNIQVESGENINLATIMQIPTEYQDITGTVSGTVVNALTGVGMQGLTINIRKDINNKTGEEILQTITTSVNGTFSTGELTNGVYTGEVVSDNTIPTYFNFICLGTSNDAGVIAVTPLLNGDELRIVLTWGEKPGDLDSHISGAGQHIYFGHRIGTGVNLDRDDTTAYGPETITLDFNKITPGIYKYYVHWYSGSGTWNTSGAKVQVYMGSNLVKEFYVPDSMTTSSGDWNIFTIDTTTKIISIL